MIDDKPVRRGRFITLEGPEGAGKSTQVPALRAHVEKHGHPVITTREPGGTPLAERVRAILLDADLGAISHDAETLLMFAARADHIEQVIEPALANGSWVICDRFTDATFAYQGGGRGVSTSRIEAVESWVQGTLRPDKVLVFDLPVKVGLSRTKRRGADDRFEREELAFFERVRATYLQRASQDPNGYAVIDASNSVGQVRESAINALRGLL